MQVGLKWLDRWATNLSGKDQAPFLCHQICGALLAAEQTGAACAAGPFELIWTCVSCRQTNTCKQLRAMCALCTSRDW